MTSGNGVPRTVGPGFENLSPVSFLLRSARVFPDRVAVVDGDRRLGYAELLAETARLAGALAAIGIGAGDRVAALLPNSLEMLSAHFAVPGSRAVLVPINVRLAPAEIAYILQHSGARCLVVDREYADVVDGALRELADPPTVLEAGPGGSYDDAIDGSEPRRLEVPPEDSLMSINYTSGTTGRPKGVMYTHRGSYLHALGVIAECGISSRTNVLWTLPMFHCHGWAFTWAVTAMGGRHVCIRKVTAAEAWDLIARESVTHLCGAPTVLETLLSGAPDAADAPAGRVRVYTGGAPPSPATIRRCESLDWDVTHLYGLTETYGPIGVCEWHPEWDALPDEQRARLKARQGVESVVSCRLRVVDADGSDVPPDGETVGEIVAIGNNVTIGYYLDQEGTDRAFSGGHFHSGDAAVVHPDGYLEIRDRLKDVIVSGGENISTIEVEQALMACAPIAQAAVIGMPDEKWGETPWAFVVPQPGAQLDPEALRNAVRERLAGYKLPSRIIVVEEIPTTATGKVQKFKLRELAENA